MDVLLVAPDFAGLPGQQAYVDALASLLPARVRVTNLRKPPFAHGPTVRTLAAWGSYPRIRRRGAHVVHATDTFCAVAGADVLTIHDLIPLLVSREPTARLHVRMFGRRLRAIPRVIVPTRTWAGAVVETLGIDRERIRVIPQGCDLALFAGDHPRPAAMAPDRRNLLVVGALRPYKRVLDLVRAAALLPGVRLVRTGAPDPSPYARRCREAARDLGVELVEVGRVPAHRMPGYYQHADLLVYASRAEGFGLPPLEAMACGTGSLLSDVPVFHEVYGDHAHYLPSSSGPRRLAEAITHALEHQFPRDVLRTHAARYPWSATARQTFAVYEEVARGPAAPTPAAATTRIAT